MFPAHNIKSTILEFQPNVAFVTALNIIKSFFELHIVILMWASIKDLTRVIIHSGNKFAMDAEGTEEELKKLSSLKHRSPDSTLGLERSCLFLITLRGG